MFCQNNPVWRTDGNGASSFVRDYIWGPLKELFGFNSESTIDRFVQKASDLQVRTCAETGLEPINVNPYDTYNTITGDGVDAAAAHIVIEGAGAALGMTTADEALEAARRGYKKIAHVGVDTTQWYRYADFKNNLLTFYKATESDAFGFAAHHVFPHKHWRWFADHGIDVNDPAFGAFWEAIDHNANWYAYDQWWIRFMQLNEDAEIDDLINAARTVMKTFHQQCPF